jgi:hypothetical protein
MFKKLSDNASRILSFFLNHPPGTKDALILSFFVILITYNPFYTRGEINLFELGIYLPGIQAILDGQVPYRDFFHLRGPLELYMPTLLMKVFGMHLSVLYTYFFVGNVLCLVLCVWILKELLRTRLILYLAVPVIVARTFPRVVYMIWGGMRYAWGLMAALFVIKFFQTKKVRWMFWAGLTTAAGLFTSIEIGIYVIFGVGVVLTAALVLKIMERPLILKAGGIFALGCAVIVVPYFLYLASQQAFMPYIDATLNVVFNMQKTFDPHLVSIYPHNLKDALVAMSNVVHTNFKHMTPSYMYLALMGYVGWHLWKRKSGVVPLCLLFLGVYGFIMYNTGFRGLWASQFEMALMPEKILYFFLVEAGLLALWAGATAQPWKKIATFVFVFALLGSSLGYSIARFNHRFVAFKILTGQKTDRLKPLAKEETGTLEFERAKGMVTTVVQAQELEAMMKFLATRTQPTDIVFTYPELGSYNFFADRPFLGRFPIVTFSWMNEKWHRGLVDQLRSGAVKYLVLQKQMPPDWYQVYLGPEANRAKHTEVMALIESEFVRTDETPLSYIYEPKRK